MEINIQEIINQNVESLLTEGRLEDVKSKYHEDGHSLIDWLSENDPSGNNKYLAWMAKQALYSIREIRNGWGDDEWYLHRMSRRWKVDKDKLVDDINYFHNNTHKYEKKDINQYKSFNELDDATEIAKTKLSRRELKDQGGEKIYEDDNFVLIHPKTHEASCKYGSRTRWCVTMRGYTGYFERYSTHGPLFFLVDKRRLPAQNSPQYMRKAPDYYKVALHYQPQFPRVGDHYGGIVTNQENFSVIAQNLDKNQFINSANRDNVKLDFWNVQDKNVTENTVIKYLGGPGRGQKERGTTALNNFKDAMEKYTKRLLGDFWEKVHENNIENIQQQKNEIQEEIRKVQRKRDYYWDLHERLDNAAYYMNQLVDTQDLKTAYYIEDSDEVISVGDIEISQEKLEQIRSKRSEVEDMATQLNNKINELNQQYQNLDNQGKHKFAFYDLTKNVPQQ